jgi:hypothetical protein
MSVLKRKAERTGILTLRLPDSALATLKRLRPMADERGYDTTASLVDAAVRCIKQMCDELTPKAAPVHNGVGLPHPSRTDD